VPGDQLRTRARPNATDAEHVETTRSDDYDTLIAHRKRVMSG
jgi:hypothetical protein